MQHRSIIGCAIRSESKAAPCASWFACVVMGLLCWPAPALADDGWRFRLTPYVWFAGIKGDIATIPGSPSVPIDISASDALDDTEASLMIILDAKRGRHGVYADLVYSDVSSDEELLPSPIDLVLRSDTETTIGTLAYEYELYNRNGAVIDLLAGARYWSLDSKLQFRGGHGILAGRKVMNSESWVDPVLGFKGRMPLGGTRFFAAGGVGFGGFGVGSDDFYELNVNLGYQWTPSVASAFGYRLFDVDYDDDGFLYDVKQEGWQLGLVWSI